MKIKESLVNDVVKWRHHLHQYPERSYQEYKTTEFIYNLLQTFEGLEVSRPTETGVLAVLKGTKRTENPKIILFRGDIDALPIQEETDVPFKSKIDGMMHACGHDCHTAMLLGAAKALSDMRDDIAGEIRFMFQHAEEVVPGGSSEFITAGAVDNVDYAFALHVDPYIKAGQFQLNYGVSFGTADDFKVKVIGKGTHASQPENGVDSIAITAQIITNLQHIVSRNISPLYAPVVSVTRIHAGDAFNVIPSIVELGGTVRAVTEESRLTARKQVETIIRGISHTHGASCEIEWDIGYGTLENADAAVDVSKRSMEEVVGADQVIVSNEPKFGTEDFANISERVPSSMQQIGGFDESFGEAYPLHHSNMQIADKTLQYGVEYFVTIAKNIVMN